MNEHGLPEVRASDAERETVASDLGASQAEGRLTLDEFSQRLDLVYASRTRDELAAVTEDLPAPTSPARKTGWIVSILGGSARAGRWRANERLRAVAVMGGCDIDLSRAVVTARELHLTCFALLGGISITVPRGVDVELSGFSLIGGRDLDVGDEPSRPGAPAVRVRAFNLLGGISISNPPEKRL